MTSIDSLRRSVGYVESEGERIYFEVTGEGRPVVLCHGLGGNHAIWWQQVEAFAAGHQLIVWDQRAFGNSTAGSGDVTPAAARRDLLALVDQLGLETFDLVGQSMGGWVALGVALEHPARIRSLVLSTTLAGAERASVDRLVHAEPNRDRFNRREHPVLSAQFCREHPDLGVLYNQISSFGLRPDPAQVLAAMAADRLEPRALDVPTLVLMADDDRLCPPLAMARVAATLGNATIMTLPGGHSLYYEDPVSWNKAVLDFLDSAG